MAGVQVNQPRLRPLWQIDLVGILACAGLVAAWYGAGVEPLMQAKETRITLDSAVEHRRQKQEALKSSKNKHEEQLSGLKERVNQAKIELQRPEHINNRLRDLTELATAHRLRVDDIKPGSPANQAHYTGVPIRISGEGGYQAAARFFHALHGKYSDVGITGFELKGEPEAPSKPATFAVQLLWYAAPPDVTKK